MKRFVEVTLPNGDGSSAVVAVDGDTTEEQAMLAAFESVDGCPVSDKEAALDACQIIEPIEHPAAVETP